MIEVYKDKQAKYISPDDLKKAIKEGWQLMNEADEVYLRRAKRNRNK